MTGPSVRGWVGLDKVERELRVPIVRVEFTRKWRPVVGQGRKPRSHGR